MTADETFTAALLGFFAIVLVSMVLAASLVPVDPLRVLMAGYR